MVPLIMPIGALLVGIALLLLGSGLLNTLLALKSELEGYSGATLGLIMSGYFIGFFVGTLLALPLIRRVGHVRAFACCAALVASSVLLHILLVDPLAWLLIRILTGIALVILYTVIESWLNGQTPADKRARVFAIYMTVNLGALALAQQLLRFDTSISHLLFVLAAILVCLSVVPVTWTRLQQPEVHNVERLKLRQLWQTAPVAMAGSLLSGLAMGAFWGLGAAYATRVGLAVNDVAMFISCGILGGAICQFPLGRYSDSRDRRRVLALVSLAAALLALAVLWLSASTMLLFIAIAAYGGVAFAVYPLAVAHMVDHLQPQSMLAGGSALLLVHGIGAVLGPLLAGQFMQVLGANGLPLYWLVTQALLALFAFWSLRAGEAEDPAEHGAEFIAMVRTTPAALEMLPQEESEPDAHGVWGGEHSGAGH
ncbi:MAG: MFS transporter [Gammaproteobacteria bacterium]|uniref:MFS transporter n=1 Tax=Pseudomaricurvus alcaniphilus TaxID=1166482 RepID=UPI001409444A|nr:MFS transporter [Pseudomaricurvus alcaniphilus]MBR9909621.1 MFS transporter [Gammaproteobacteria bacterium]NHN36963.1 MFS transporter [Pseudomaricurvus alcaniphilus]